MRKMSLVETCELNYLGVYGSDIKGCDLGRGVGNDESAEYHACIIQTPTQYADH